MKFIKGLILVATLLSVSCKGTKNGVTSPRKVKCESAILTSDSVERGYFTGKVIAATDVNLGFRIPGIIEEICATDGSFVRKGEVIARLDSRDYALQLSATQAEYDAIKAEVDRVVALYADESVSANDYDKATNGLRAITAKLKAHRNALADTELRAPMDGYLQKSNFDKGEAVAAGTPVVSMISATAPEISIDIPAKSYLRQSDFEGATATIDLFEGITFDLILTGITPKANLNQLYKATFVIDGVDSVMPSAGMSAMVEMRYITHSTPRVQIPFSAIVEQEGNSSVWVIKNNRVHSRPVKVKEVKRNGGTTIERGISVGEVVVVAGVNSLKEGQEVSILQEASASNVGGVK